ncbi:MAG: nitrilase [Firmicutes bacterium]|nr:nitrilase [Bacillota bacterium]
MSWRGILDKAKEKAFSYLLWWKSRPSLVQRVIDEAPAAESGGRADTTRAAGDARGAGAAGAGNAPTLVRVAAVQMRLEFIRSAEDYARKILDLTRRAVEQGAELIAFPEDAATGLIGFIPGIEKLATGSDLQGAVQEMAGDAKVADIFRFISPAVRRIYEATFSGVARKFGVYVVAGSAILPNARGQMVNVAYVYGPDGRKLGEQDKCHFIPMEVEWGLQTGDDLTLFEAPWGRFAAPVCMDATYFETFRILAQRGADVVVIPSANPEEYNLWKALRGIWPRVQESQVYGIHSCMVGEFMGLVLTGRSGIFAPMELTPGGDGVLAQAERFDQEDVVVVDLDLEALRRLRQEQGVQRGFNLALYERYLPGIYIKR